VPYLQFIVGFLFKK